MKIIACLCTKGGLLFNNRRQSRDRVLMQNLSEYVADGAIFINDFSSSLFLNTDMSAIEVSSPLDAAGENDYVFVENLTLSGYESKINEMVIYRWNRDYPADFRLDIKPLDIGLSLVESSEFKGSSHDRITREIYRK